MSSSFEVNDQTLALIEQLYKPFGVSTNADVIRKALALAITIGRHANCDNTITIISNKNNLAATIYLAK